MKHLYSGLTTVFLFCACFTVAPQFVYAQGTFPLQLGGAKDLQSRHGYGNSQWLHPQQKPVEGLVRYPALQSPQPIYYAAKLGDSEDHTFSMVLDHSDGIKEKYDTAYIDLNNDNKITLPDEQFAIQVGTASSDHPIRIAFQVTVGKNTSPYYLNFAPFKYRDRDGVWNIHATLRNSSYYGGTITLQDREHDFVILDLDTNGKFNDYEPKLFDGDRFGIDLNQDGRIRHTSDPATDEVFPLNRYSRIGEHWYSLKVAPEGSQVKIEIVDPPLGTLVTKNNVHRIVLRNAEQTLELFPVAGKAVAVQGQYQVEELELRSSEDPSVTMRAAVPDGELELEILPDKETELTVGGKLTFRMSAVPKGFSQLEILPVIEDSQGLRYQLPRSRQYEQSCGFVARDDLDRAVYLQAIGLSTKPEARGFSWSLPAHLDGTYTLYPVGDLTGFDYEVKTQEVQIHRGKLVSKAEQQ